MYTVWMLDVLLPSKHSQYTVWMLDVLLPCQHIPWMHDILLLIVPLLRTQTHLTSHCSLPNTLLVNILNWLGVKSYHSKNILFFFTSLLNLKIYGKVVGGKMFRVHHVYNADRGALISYCCRSLKTAHISVCSPLEVMHISGSLISVM